MKVRITSPVRILPSLSLLLVVLLSFTSCFYQRQRSEAWEMEGEDADSLGFVSEHHFSVGYTFSVQTDSLQLCTEIPSRAQLLSVVPDSVSVRCNDVLIVAQICMVPEDEVDSVWVKVARDQATQGWLRESALLRSVAPDDPISVAIFRFSGNHVRGTLILVSVVLFFLFLQFLYSYMRSFCLRRDEERPYRTFWSAVFSPYPTLLRITMSGSAVFYASMQLFAPHQWADFYFHPTLNPFAVSPLLGAFLFSVWTLLLFFLATADDAFRQLGFVQFVLYMVLTVTILAILYLFFSLTTLVFVGYPLCLLFIVWSVCRYLSRLSPRYRCGECGKPFHAKGFCPHCGARNE